MVFRFFYTREKLTFFILVYFFLLILFLIKTNSIHKKQTEKSSFYNATVIEFIDSKLKSTKTYCKAEVLKTTNPEANFKLIIDKTVDSFDELETSLKNLSFQFGGRWLPRNCYSLQKIAIIIPYRDRLTNMKLFLKNMHPFFVRQNIHYGIYFIEPVEKLVFNRGTLMNIGFIESLKDSNNLWDCFFFHDVDMIAIDERNIYKCNRLYPVHYAVSLSKFNYIQ
jgi:hypothetical protein